MAKASRQTKIMRTFTDLTLIRTRIFYRISACQTYKVKAIGFMSMKPITFLDPTSKADFGLKKTSTSLRVTINELAQALSDAGSRVVGCYTILVP